MNPWLSEARRTARAPPPDSHAYLISSDRRCGRHDLTHGDPIEDCTFSGIVET